jgi:polysaccharide export outer membrane protein
MSERICRLLAGVIFFIWLASTSCLPQKEMIYFQTADTTHRPIAMDSTGKVFIQQNDILSIYVSSVSPDASRFFNYASDAATGNNAPGNNYVVDVTGCIQLPFAGNIKVEGLTMLQARDSVKAKLSKYLSDPTVKMNLVNFSVTVLGEVAKPGVYSVPNEKITLTDALAMAGDLTVFGRRTNIMVIREINGKKEFGTVDITSRDAFASPYYQLRGSDIVYVEAIPQKKATAQTIYRVGPLVLSALSLIVVLVSLTNN